MGSLASAVDEQAMLDPHALGGPALAEHLVELRRQINRLEALYLDSLVVFDRTGAASAEHGSTAAWARATLHLSPNTASRDVHLARDLADAMPATRAALGDGDISVPHAQQIARLRTAIGDDALAAAEPHVVEVAKHSTPLEMHQVITHVIHSYGPEKVHDDEKDDYANRSLHGSKTMNGVGVGNWTLHPVGHETVMTAINALSRPTPGDDRSPAQRRADALITICEIAMRSGQLPMTGGVKPHVTVTASLDTITDQPGAPAATYGFGAVSSGEWARRIACDASVARVIFGPDGAILDAGRSIRTFTPAQMRAIIARDTGCIWWGGCDLPPAWCEGHHIEHWAHGGLTAVENGVLLCARHHDRVHLYGHQIIKTDSGLYIVNPIPGSDPRWQKRHPNKRAGP